MEVTMRNSIFFGRFAAFTMAMFLTVCGGTKMYGQSGTNGNCEEGIANGKETAIMLTPDSSFTHIGISPNTQKGGAVWLGPVTDEEYKEATT
jgi:hypothetical protein